MNKSRIMVVDDEYIVTLQLERYLTSIGHEVVGKASSGEDAVVKARELRPCIIIMDIIMPGKLDGIDAAKIIIEELEIPVIFLTAYKDVELFERANDIGPLGYIVKPFDQIELMAAIEIALHKTTVEQQQEQSTDDMHMMSMAVEHSSCPTVIADAECAIEYVNPRFTQITGYTLEDAINQNLLFLRSSMMPPDKYRRLWETITSGKEWSGELCNKTKDGEFYWYYASIIPVKNTQGNIVNFICVSKEIGKSKRTEEIAMRTAYYDDLTNLPNQTLFNDRFAIEMAHERRSQNKLAVMILDLDGFKEINDMYGCRTGDLVLQEAARRLVRCSREEDTVARIGEHEFTVLLSRLTRKEDVSKIADRILSGMDQPFKPDGVELHIATNIGITFFPDDGDGAKDLIRNAENCLNIAKKQVKSSYNFVS